MRVLLPPKLMLAPYFTGRFYFEFVCLNAKTVLKKPCDPKIGTFLRTAFILACFNYYTQSQTVVFRN